MTEIENRKSKIENLTCLTPSLLGVGGTIKQRAADFLVEEQPLYEPTGEGEHLYLFIEKFNLTTHDAVRRVAKAFRVPRHGVGYAGLKDKHAVTRQHLSIHLPKRDADAEQEGIRRVEHHPHIKVLWAVRHENKLRLGHLAANRFVIYIRDVEPASVIRAKPILDTLVRRGVPNYFGEQRFGYRANSHRVGRALLLGDAKAALDAMLGEPDDTETEHRRRGREAYVAGDYATALALCPKRMRYERQALDALRQGLPFEQAIRHVDRAQCELMLSAWQSALFNRVLDVRLRDGTFDRLLPGDLAQKHDNRAVFAVDEAIAAAENQPGGRVDALELSPSGPMWGSDMMRAAGSVGAMEQRILLEDGVTLDQVASPPWLELRGQRRPLRVPLRDPDLSAGVDEHGPYIRVAFELPRGAFATVALREIMKNDSASDRAENAEP